jgi:hypothetical protein
MECANGCRVSARDARECRHRRVRIGGPGSRTGQILAFQPQDFLQFDELGLRLGQATEPDPRKVGE